MVVGEKSVSQRVRVDNPGLLRLLEVLREDKGSSIYVLIWHRGKLVDFHRTGDSMMGVDLGEGAKVV